MTPWRPQRLRFEAMEAGRIDVVIQNAVDTGVLTVSSHPSRPPIFSLKHLCVLSGTNYSRMRAIIARSHPDPYKLFRIRKRSSPNSYRIISVPDADLLRVQKWISQNILRTIQPHKISAAFFPGDDIVSAANVHSSSKWLIKLDVQNFFESITELSVYRVFVEAGYQPLVAFEMARLCTRVRSGPDPGKAHRWKAKSWRYNLQPYRHNRMGYLPQGAPTSPILSSLCMREFDNELQQIAQLYGLRVTRYADDIALSTEGKFSRPEAQRVIKAVYQLMGEYGLSPNLTKTAVRTPGCRKLVLGLLVDGPKPRLPRRFRDNLRQHLYYLDHPNIGPVQHARNRGFDSILSMRAHILGLIAFAKQVDEDYAEYASSRLNAVRW